MSDVAKVEILGCPFCGGKPVVRKIVEEYPAEGNDPAGEYDAHYEINCDPCGFGLGEEYRDDVIAAWNRRAPLPVRADEAAE